MLVDHRPEISRMLREAMKRHGLVKRLLENESLRHVITHGYRKSKQFLVIGHYLYCSELWDIVGKPEFHKLPIFQFPAGWVIGIQDAVVELDDQLDLQSLEEHFETMIGQAVAPLVRSVQTPAEAVCYAMDHRMVLLLNEMKINEYLLKWTEHYGLELRTPPNVIHAIGSAKNEPNLE